MKKIILLFLLILSLGGKGQTIIQTNVDDEKVNYEYIFRLLQDDLKLIDCSNFTVYVSDSKFDKTTRRCGALHILDKNAYIINIDMEHFRRVRIKIFIHEMVHVSQIENKRMRIGKNYVYFEGEVSTNKTPHDKRAHEIEAMDLTKKLFWKYRKQLNKVNQTILKTE